MKTLRIGFWGVACAALVALVAWGAPRNTAPVTGAVTANRVIIYPGPDDTVAKLKALGVSKIESFGVYWLAEATAAQFTTLQQTLSGRVEEVNQFNQIELRDNVFNVKQSVAVPAHLREASTEARRLRLVQFKGPVLPEWLKQLQAIPSLWVVNYVPNNAYLVSVRSEAEEQLQGLAATNGPAQWVGVYQPSFKVPQSLQKAAGVVEVKIAVLNDENVTTTLQVIHRYSLATVEERWTAMGQLLVSLKLNADDLPALAQLPGVVWIQPGYSTQKHDEVQALVLACKTNNAGGPVVGTDSYTNFLARLGFSTTRTFYPVLDICDTGIDETWPSPPLVESGSCQISSALPRWHPSFYYPSPPISSALSCCSTRGYITRMVYGTGTDTDGHGTRVASVAIGYDSEPNELIDCITEKWLTNTVTNVTYVVNGCTNNVCWVNPVSGMYTCANFIVDCAITNIGQVIFCNTNDAALATTQPPPWYLSRRDGNGFQLGLGVSPYGRFGASDSTTAATDPVGLVAGVYLATARISNNSWGEGLSIGGNDGAYDVLSQDYDSLTRDALGTGVTNTPGHLPMNQEMLFIFAGGNANGVDSVGGYGDVLVTPPATAKNVITVGATTLGHSTVQENGNTFAISTISSFGPTRDGRFKPDVVAPGAGISAAISQGAYTHTDCGGCDPNAPSPFACATGFSTIQAVSQLYNLLPGAAGPNWTSFPNGGGEVTSYSAAAVAGGAQLLWYWFQNKLSQLQPSPAMMKAYILNSARYLPIINPLTGAQDKLPSIAQGMGMMDLSRMFDSVPRVLRDESTPRAIDVPLYYTNVAVQQTFFSQAGQTYEVSGQVADATKPFRITLAWTDPPGNPAVLKQLVNDLDLQVSINGQIYAGNDFDTQYAAVNLRPKYDHLNNVESVFFAPNAFTNGTTWNIVVRALTIAGVGVPKVVGAGVDQDFAMVIYNGSNTTDTLPVGVLTNNSCQTAANIVTFPFIFSNTLSSVNYANVQPSPLAGRGGIDEFFKIPMPSPATTFNVNTYGSSFDTVLSVWRGQCGALVEEVSNNDSSNTFQSAASFTADGVSDYYIVAEPHNNGPGGLLVLNVQASSSPVTLSPSSVLFADQISGTTSSWQVVTLQNGLSVPLEVQNVYLQGSNATEFVILSDNCTGAQLPTNGACAVNIAFAPTNAALKSAELVVVDNATGSPRTVPLSGNGLAAAPVVCLSANRLSYNSTGVGATDTVQTVSIRNCGTAPLNLTNAVITGPARADYFISANTCGGVPFTTATVAPGSNCIFSIDFAPTTFGNRSAVLTFYDDAGDNPQTVLLAGKGCATISISPATLAAPTGGVAYSQSIIASGGGAPYTYAMTSGGLPGGLTFTAAGTISGNPTNIGAYIFQVTATDAYGCTGVKQYTLTVGCPTLTVLPTGLPDGLQWSPYTNTISVIGGVAPFTFTVNAGALPGGLTLNSTNGVLSGTPSAAGPASFTIGATDVNGCNGSQSYTITINPTVPILGFAPVTLPTFGDVVLGMTGAVQSVTVTNAGTAPLIITSVALAGSNPGEFVLDPPSACLGASVPAGGTCVVNIRLKPTTSGNKGATVVVYDNSAGAPHSFTVKGAGIAPQMALNTASLDYGTQTVNVASAPQRVIVKNIGDGPMTITGVAIICTNGTDFTVVNNNCVGTPIQPGDSCSIALSFKPGATLPRVGTLVITGTATNSPQQVSLSGVGAATAPSIAYDPIELFFGDTGLGSTSAVQAVTITNAGTAALVINSLGFTGSDSNNFFVPYSNCLDATIPPGGNCTIPVRFAPVTSGPVNSALQILSNSGNGTNDVPVLGSGVAPVMLLSTNVLDFGTNTVNGTTPAQTIYIQNIGNAVMTISNIVVGGVNTGDFTIVASDCLSNAILPGAQCAVAVTFHTTTKLARSATLTITGDATNAPQVVALSGVGEPCHVIVLSPASLPALTVGSAYSQTLTATNGTGTYTYQLTSGSLPSGLSLSARGVLAGATTATGNYSFTIQATDAFGCTGTRSYTLAVACPLIPILPATATLPAATAGVFYNQSLAVTNGTAPFVFSVVGGSLPTGLTLATDGSLSGVPTVGGSFSFTIQVQDANGCTNTRSYTIAVSCPTIALSPTTLPNPVAGVPYTQNLTATNGVAPYFFQITSGALPAGLTLGTRGQLSGTPRVLTNSTFTVQVQDSNGCIGSQTYTVGVSCPAISLVPGTLLDGNKGLAYSQTFAVSGSSSVFNFAVTSGTLPPGLTLSTGGALTGTPTTFGIFSNITITATDASGCAASQTYTIAITCQTVTVGPLTLPSAAVNTTYQQSLQVSGGTAPIVFAITRGALPVGVTMSSAGVISGTPITAGTYTFTVTATDANTCNGSRDYTINVSCVALVLTPQVLPTPIFGVPYTASIIAVGHTGTVSFAHTTGSLPPGLDLTSSGVVTGTPTLFGSFTFKVTAYDPVSTCSGDRFYTLSVGCQTLTEGPATLPIGSVGSPYSATFTGSGGRSPYTFAQTSGSLPSGLSLLSNGMLTGTPTSASSVFAVTVTDANGCSTTASYTLILSNACQISMTPASLPSGTVGVAYNQTLSGTGGTAPYTFMVGSGVLPAGLTLSTDGHLTGAPVASGAFTFTAVGLDANGCWAVRTYTLTIACGTIAVAPASLSAGTRGSAYSNLFTATSSAVPVTFAVTAGSPPSGITLDPSGVLAGVPTADGTFGFTVTATDAANCTASLAQLLVINPAADLAVSQSVAPNPVVVGSNLTYTIVITNRGPSAASSLVLSDALPASVTFVSASSGCGATGCNLGTLASGGNMTVTITATAGAQGVLTNTVSVSSSATDLNLANNTATTISMASNVVLFSAARQMVNASAGQAVVIVARQGDSRAPASVEYATSDDSAQAGVDYTPTVGTVTFNPGDVERSVVVPLLSQAGSKVGKSVKLVLRNPVGATLGRATTMLTILSSAAKSSMAFTNSAGDLVTVQLTGAGQPAVSLVDAVHGPIDRITLTGTDAKSALSIAVKRGRQGTGIVTVGSIVGGQLKSINAAAVNLVGDGINLNGALGSLLVNAVSNSAVVVQGDLGTVSVNVLSSALVSAGYTQGVFPLFGDGTFTGSWQIKSLTAKSMAGSVIAAAKIGKVQLGTVTTNNSGVAFGVLAQAKPGSVLVSKPKFNWKAKGAVDQSVGDFHVQY